MPPHANFPGVLHISLAQLTTLPYKEQAIWFMNGFWSDDKGGMKNEAEAIFGFYNHFVKLDHQQTPPKGESGNELDQLFAAKFLEDHEQTLTAVERKAAMQEIDVDNNGRMALIEYLTFHFKKGVDEVVRAPQGAADEIAAANKVISTVMAMLPEIETKLAEQKEQQKAQLHALQETRMAKMQAEEAYAQQLEAEIELQQAVKMLEASKLELEEAVKALHEQEAALARQIADLEAKSTDMSLGQVARGKAANMLIGLRNEDPLPLRKAKITAEAALRRVEREQKHANDAADEAKTKAEACKAKAAELATKEKDLEIKKQALAKAIADLEASYTDLQSRMAEAHAVLVELKTASAGLGAVWWMERQLFDADYYLPQSRRKYDHSKPFQFNPPEGGAEVAEPIAKFEPAPVKPALPAKPALPNKPGRLSINLSAKRAEAAAAARVEAEQGGADAPGAAAAALAAAEAEAAPVPALEPTPEPEEVGPFDATLYYFDHPGRAEQIKLCLAEAGIKWKFSKCGAAEFKALKPKLTYGQLPLLEIDGLELVQAGSIVRYLARRSNTFPTIPHSEWSFDALVDACEDLRQANMKAMPRFSGTGHSAKVYKETVMAKHLGQFESLLAANDFFIDNKFTFADLDVFNVVTTAKALVPAALDGFPKLAAFVDRIAGREKVAAYLGSTKCLSFPEPLA